MARHPKEHYKMDKNERHKISKDMKRHSMHDGHHVAHRGHDMSHEERYESQRGKESSPRMGSRGHVPATISNDPHKHAQLPTEPMFMNYPYCDYLDQYVGDSIVDADRTQDMGAREMRRQNSLEKY